METSIMDALKPMLTMLAPYAVKCVVVILVCFGIYRFYEKLAKKDLPKELKALLPILIAIAAQLIYPERFVHVVKDAVHLSPELLEKVRANHKLEGLLKNIGIGVAIGALSTTFYDVVIKFVFRFIKTKTPEAPKVEKDPNAG